MRYNHLYYPQNTNVILDSQNNNTLRFNNNTDCPIKDIPFTRVFFTIIEELYIYCHLKIRSNTDPTKEQIEYGHIIMTIIMSIFSLTIIKMLIIFSYFLIINTLYHTYNFCENSIKRKCKINCPILFKSALLYLIKVFKKFYTYNFYSYENKIYGTIISLLYMTFIVFNILFSYQYTRNISEEIVYSLQILQIISFELNIFFELVCGFFYITRRLGLQYLFVISSFIFLNIVVLIAEYIKVNNCMDIDNDQPRRIANLIYNAYFSLVLFGAVYKTYKYNLTCMYIVL